MGNGLVVHPRATHLITALPNYMRKKRGTFFVDEPEDPQHPFEDLVDSLGSGLLAHWPDGRKPDLKLPRVPVRSVL